MKNDFLPLEGRLVLITGSSRGIGAATARLAKEYGAEVILHGKSESPRLKALSNELGCRYISCNVADKYEVEKKVKDLEIDVLINSAGINISKPFSELTENDWIEVFKVNVLGIVNFSQAVIPKMLERKYGKIVNVASAKGFTNSAGRAAYSSSKAAVISLTGSMAKELSPYVLVNAVAPGFTRTDMTSSTWSERVRRHVEHTLLKRMAEPEEIAEVILFLASDKSNYIVGQTILADGGFSMGY